MVADDGVNGIKEEYVKSKDIDNAIIDKRTID